MVWAAPILLLTAIAAPAEGLNPLLRTFADECVKGEAAISTASPQAARAQLPRPVRSWLGKWSQGGFYRLPSQGGYLLKVQDPQGESNYQSLCGVVVADASLDEVFDSAVKYLTGQDSVSPSLDKNAQVTARSMFIPERDFEIVGSALDDDFVILSISIPKSEYLEELERRHEKLSRIIEERDTEMRGPQQEQ